MGLPVRGNARITESSTMSHLDNIAARHRKGLVRDAFFAAFIALAAIVSITTVTKAVVASAVVAPR